MDPFLLPPWISIASVVGASAAGAFVFAILRPHKNSWLFGVGTIAAGTLMGGFLTFGVCEWMGWPSLHIHNIVGFGVGLLGVTLARAMVMLTESHAMNIVTAALRRMLGLKDDPPKEG